MKSFIPWFGLLVWLMAAHAPAQPYEVIGTIRSNGAFGEGFDITDSHALVAVGRSKLLRIVDFSDHSSPTLVRDYTLTTATNGLTHDVDVDGQLAYCSTSCDLIVLDITDPTQPIEIGRLGRGFQGIRRVGKTLYGGSGCANDIYTTGTFNTIDVSDPTSPTLLASLDMAWPHVAAIHLPLAIIGSGPFEPVRILDVGDPTSPTLLSTIDFPYLGGAAVRDNYLYLANASNDEFRIYDISNPSSPNLLREFGGSIGASFSTQMEWLDHRLFILDIWGGSIRYLDVSDPLEPFREGLIHTGLGSWVSEFVLTPRFLYAVGDYGFSIIGHTIPVGLSQFQVE